jgi:uncharacterized protein (TIGR02145 family)
MKRLLLFIVGMSLLFSCEYLNGPTTINKEITTDYLLNGTLDVYLSNNQVFRYKGKPGVVSIPIGNSDLSTYEPCFVLHVATGTTKATTVSSAIVKLDDLEVLNTSDFPKNTGQHTFEICNLTPTSVLTVEVRGEPGSYIDVWIEGKLKGLTDCDGNTYKTVAIGNQVWMAENLKTTKYRDCSPIENVADFPNWLNLKTGAYCWYLNDASTYKTSYGALYNWYAVNDSRKICPLGWSVPTDKDWEILENYLGGPDVAGGRLKEIGITHWASPNAGATDANGFTALPGGFRNSWVSFGNVGLDGDWWSSSSIEVTSAWSIGILYNYEGSYYGYNLKTDGRSVRCIKEN